MSQRRDHLSLLAALHRHGVEYAVVGGVAVNAHGFVRNTRDLDIFFRPTEDNAKAVWRVLAELGAPLEGVDHTDLLADYAHYQLHTECSRADLLASIGDMPFDQVWANRVDAEIDGVTVRFISKSDLIANKLQVGRLIDLADVERLSLLPEVAALQLPPEAAEKPLRSDEA